MDEINNHLQHPVRWWQLREDYIILVGVMKESASQIIAKLTLAALQEYGLDMQLCRNHVIRATIIWL